MSAPPYAGPPAPPPQAPPKQGKGRRRFGIVVLVFGVLGAVLTGLFGYEIFLNRAGTTNPAYEATMWRNEPADELFPATIADFGQSDDRRDERNNVVGEGPIPTWIRVGIAQDTACEAGLTPAALKVVQKYGCKAVMRATYVDRSNQHVATIAMMVVDNPKKKVEGSYSTLDVITSTFQNHGSQADSDKAPIFAVKPFAVPGTPAAKFNAAAVNGQYETNTTYYPIVAVVGAVDGRQAAKLPPPWNQAGGTASTTGDRKPYTESAQGIVVGFGTGGEN